jgi:hypothetical protein
MKDNLLGLVAVDELVRLLDEARGADAASSRRRARQLEAAATEGATLAGTLLDLAEAGTSVSVGTTAGRTHHGVVRLVGTDFVVLGGGDGESWLATASVTTVRTTPDERARPASGDRPAVDLRLVEALGRVAEGRPELVVLLVGGEQLAGRLWAVGQDVVTVALAGDHRALVYVSAPAVLGVLRSG